MRSGTAGVSPFMKVSVSLAISASLLAVTADATACFDGYSASVGDVGFVAAGPYDASFSIGQARALAKWGQRIDSILPEGYSLELGYGGGGICSPSTGCDQAFTDLWLEHGYSAEKSLNATLAKVFDGVAAKVGTPPSQARRARNRRVPIYAVQVGSFRGAGRAASLTRKLNWEVQTGKLEWEPDTFYSAGGFPAIHDVAATVPARVQGQRFHRVVVGVFTAGEQAWAYRKRVIDAGMPASISVSWLR
jgi:hypothetical protein